MAITSCPAPAAEARYLSPDPNARTDNRLHAYLASLRLLKGVCYNDDLEDACYRGRSLIERLALSAAGGLLPRLRLTAKEVADVLAFISSCEPVERSTCWREPKHGPSHVVGRYLLLQALEQSLRALPS
jgi:hypothetical protein